MVSAACGTNKKESSTNSGAASSSSPTAKIALIAPLSGDLSALGLGMRNAVDLAVKQANDAGKVKGWKLEFDPEDDTAKADVGAQVASKVASDSAMVGVVGTLNTSVALQVAPILQKASIVEISPANTGIALTGRDKIPNQVRVFDNYFRVATTDDIQGPFAADFVFDTLGKKKVAVVHDKKAYGQGLSEAFKGEFTKKGGTVLTTETINPGDKDFSAVISKIKPLAPELLYYGGEYPEASLLTSQMKAAGLNIPLMGGDGLVDKTYGKNAGPAAEGDFATNVGAPAEQLASAKKFIDDYKAAGYKDDFSAYGAYAFDAANVIINAMAKVLPGKSKIDDTVRKDIIKAVQATQLDGVTGKVSFDAFGDTTSKVLTVYKIKDADFKPEKTADFGSGK
jgi:branched-chain amino acid transport system substrate-binding protein